MQFQKFKVIVTLAMLTLVSCSKEENVDLTRWLNSEENFFQAWIETVAPPPNIVSGTPATFSVSYIKPNPCYFLVGIKTYQDGFSVNLFVLLDYPDSGSICPQVLVGETSQFQILFPKPGKYTINFKGMNGTESLQVTVK